MKKINILTGLMVLLAASFFFVNAAAAQEVIKKEIVIQVPENIIVLPEGDAARVPIASARIRSSEIRELNQVYNAVKIEKLYKKDDAKKGVLEIKGLKNVTKKKEVVTEQVIVANVFTKELKKGLEEEGYNVVELNNVFIIEFEFNEEINMTNVAKAYKNLDSVIYAEYIVRNK